MSEFKEAFSLFVSVPCRNLAALNTDKRPRRTKMAMVCSRPLDAVTGFKPRFLSSHSLTISARANYNKGAGHRHEIAGAESVRV